ncbi:hypothetical protein ACFVT6_12210 [Streptomyces sp. NPDC058049]|uniref:hypothetical protein n=1 Tax=Streptomyces sp. NPDC058049 TaxID=3346314 RepID=UPI0036EBD6F1
MPQLQPAPAAIHPEPTPDRRLKTDPVRDAALQRVCARFTTMNSPQCAARLAGLLSNTSYVQAA